MFKLNSFKAPTPHAPLTTKQKLEKKKTKNN